MGNHENRHCLYMQFLAPQPRSSGGMPNMRDAACTSHLFRHLVQFRARSLASVAVGLAVGMLLPSSATGAEGLSPFEIFIKSYVDEWGKPPVSDPNAPPSRWPTTLLPPQPQTTPPYPFTEWPFGGSSAIGATVPNSQGGALMKALAPTDFGKWLKDSNIEIYGWINGGGNVSTATTIRNPKCSVAYARVHTHSCWLAGVPSMKSSVLYANRISLIACWMGARRRSRR